MTLWGFTDKCSWINNRYQGFGAALAFDSLYVPKPAYRGLAEALQ